jgi:hypothetical protein
MRRFLMLLVALLSTFSFLPGCGGTPKSPPEEQKKRLEETQANMEKGMKAMQSMPKPKSN